MADVIVHKQSKKKTGQSEGMGTCTYFFNHADSYGFAILETRVRYEVRQGIISETVHVGHYYQGYTTYQDQLLK